MEKPHHDIKTRPKALARSRVLEVPTFQKPAPQEPPRALVLTLQILAYGIPLTFLAYILYINYLPFGYNKTFTIDVGAEGDTTVGEFYLEPSPDLSERKTAADGTTYRELNGMANVVFKPNVVLKDAEITISVEGEGVSIIPPVIDFNPDDYEWDYEWDFTKPETAFTAKTSERARAEWTSCTTTPLSTGASTTAEVTEAETGTGTISEGTEEFVPVPVSENATTTATTTQVCTPIPVPDLVGNAFWFDGGMYFDGKSRLEMPGTADMFENGPFTVYVEWKPENSDKNNQQIIGHYNWELWQNSNSIQFQIGRTSQGGNFYSIRKPVDNTYFDTSHKAIISYNPSKNGYIEFYLDNTFVSRVYIGKETIFSEYGNQNLSLGFSTHNNKTNPFLTSNINKLSISKSPLLTPPNNLTLNNASFEKLELITAQINSDFNSFVNGITFDVKQK